MSESRFHVEIPRALFFAGLIVSQCCAFFPAHIHLSENDTEALGGIRNKTANADFDHSLNEALEIELEQSPFLNIASDNPAEGVPRDVCRRTGSMAILGGTISSAGTGYELALTAVSCRDETTLASVSGEAKDKAGVLGVLSQLAAKLRTSLGESKTSVERFDAPIAMLPPLQALELYGVATAVKRDKGDVPSIPLLKHAIAIAPDFPMPYATLAAIYGNLRQPTLALEYATRAYELRAHAGKRERMRIAANYFLSTGELRNEISLYKRWQESYPRDSTPYNNLGNDYAALGLLKQSLVEYQRALLLAPSVVTYTNVAGMDLNLNRLNDAQACLDRAFAGGLDGRYLHQTLYWLAFLRGDAAQMARQVAWAAGKRGDEDALLSMQSDTEAYYGRLNAARALTRRAVASAMHAGSRETAALWQINGALREAELGNANLARRGISSALALSSGRDVTLTAALTWARIGNAARARVLVNTLEKSFPSDSLIKVYWLPTIHAAIAIDDSRAFDAVNILKPVVPYELGGAGTFINYLYPAYVRGQAYLQAHDAVAAAAEFNKLVEHRGIVVNFVTGALVHLELARAYSMSRKPVEAKREYQAFFALWRGADPNSNVLKKAREEAAHVTRYGSHERTAAASSRAAGPPVDSFAEAKPRTRPFTVGLPAK